MQDAVIALCSHCIVLSGRGGGVRGVRGRGCDEPERYGGVRPGCVRKEGERDEV